MASYSAPASGAQPSPGPAGKQRHNKVRQSRVHQNGGASKQWAPQQGARQDGWRPRPAREVLSRTYWFTRLALLLVTLVIAATLAVTGGKRTSYGELNQALYDGDINSVEVVNDLPAGTSGYSTAEVRYRDSGWLGLFGVNKYAEVKVVSSPGEAGGTTSSDTGDPRDELTVVQKSVSSDLRQRFPDLTITSAQPAMSFVKVKSWRGPAWLGVPILAVLLGTLALLVNGPQPHRATKWAWFWVIVGAGPLGVLAYLLIGVPWRNIPTPASRWLTGGWAFALFIVLGLGQARFLW